MLTMHAAGKLLAHRSNKGEVTSRLRKDSLAARVAVRGISGGALTPRFTGPYRQLPVVSHLCGAQQLCNGLTFLLCSEAVSAHADLRGSWSRAYSCFVLAGCKVC